MALLFAAHGRLGILTPSRFIAKSPSQPGNDGVNSNKLWYWSLPCGPPVCVRSAYALLSRRSLRDGLRGTIVGKTLSCTVSLVTTTLATSSRLGMSYITGSRTSSMMARRPRAPVPRWIA